jgi:integrase
MKPNETTPRNRKFIRVLDGRKQPVRGLWKRGEIYYAQLVKDGHQMKRRLDAQTNAEAIAALNKLKVQRQEGKLKIIRHAPKLSEAIALYKASEVFKDKRHATRRNEETYFKAWEERLGKERVDQITPAHIIKVRDDLRADKAVGGSKAQVTKRTANLYVMALKQVFKFLVERDSMADVPRVPRLKAEKAPERPLLSDKQVSAIFVACERPGVCGRNGALLADYLRFLALTGCREAEAYRIKWADINLAQRVLTIGADGRAKNGESRTMQMTDELEGFLKDMQTRRQVDCSYLFPSPRRGKADAPVKTLRDGFKEVRDEVGLPHLGFHDFRHLFISKCVMAGVDYMTTAKWVGHKDGGVLIGKVYGHLNDEHKVAMAQRLTLFKQPENVVPLTQEQAAG